MPRRFKKIDKVFEKIIGRSEIESISSNENEKENDIIENDYLDEDAELQKNRHISDYICERIYNIFSHLQNIFKFIFGVSGIYLVWICLHYFASHLYVKFCVPSTVVGFLLSPFMTATPHCQGLRWVVYNASNMINNMWIVLGTWVGSTLLNFNTQTPHDISS
jgi:hypothetical protein